MSSESYGDPKTRERILQAAWDLLENDDGNVRLADVAERAGVSRQTVYLHFGDRTSLLIAVVDYIDETLGAAQRIAHIMSAGTATEALTRLISEISSFTERIDRVARVIETGRDHDQGLAAAWEDRMEGRRRVTWMITSRLADEEALDPEWTVETASQLLYALTSPTTWHLAVRQLGWTADEYTNVFTKLLVESLTLHRRPPAP